MIARLLDTALDRTVAPGYSRIGLAVRRRLPDWPADPPAGALAGRHVLVTGATSGLGTATADGLAALGAEVHVVVRDVEKARALRRSWPAWRCDLGDLDDVRRCAGELVASGVRFAGIVHNAGVMPPERTESPQGHELSMAVHVLGPVALTEALRPALEPRARVVLVSSGGMYAQPLPVADPEYRSGEYSPTTAYARSKRTQVELLPVLTDRWPDLDVHVMHPGWADTPGVQESLPRFRTLTRPVLRDAAEGADTAVWLVAAEPPPERGHLWHDRHPRPTSLLRRTRPSAQQRQQMWEWVRRSAGLT